MGTVPTGKLERRLRQTYLQFLAGLTPGTDVPAAIRDFEKRSRAVIAQEGGQVASLGALADFPVPKLLELSPVAGVAYDQMQQAAIQAGIAAGLNSRDTARQILNAGLGKSFRKLERLARTETVSAYWKNQWDSVADLPEIVMLWGSEESKKTCDFCLSRDGLVVEDSNIRDHPNGRCTLIPTLRKSVKYKGTLQPDGSVFMDPRWATEKTPVVKTPMQQWVDDHKAANPGMTQAVRAELDLAANQRDIYALKRLQNGGKITPAEYRAAERAMKKGTDAVPVKTPAKLTPKVEQPTTVVTKDDLTTVRGYTTNSFEFNDALRKDRDFSQPFKLGPMDSSDLATLDRVVGAKNLKAPVRVRRVVSGEAAQEALAAARLGQPYRDRAFMSTQKASRGSLSDMVDDYGQMSDEVVVFDIKLPKGYKALDVGDSLADFPGFYDEGEIIIPRNSPFKMGKPTKGPDGEWRITLEPDTSVAKPPVKAARPALTGNARADAIAKIQYERDVSLSEAVRIYSGGPVSKVSVRTPSPVPKAAPSTTSVAGGLEERLQVREVITALEKQAPGAATQLKAVRVLDESAMRLKNTNAYYMHGADEIHLNKDLFTAAANRSHKKDQKSGWFVPSGNSTAAEKALIHEFGHHIDEHLTPNARTAVFNAIADELGVSRPLGDVDGWVAKNKTRLGTEVSRYGAVDPQELLAEIWAESVLNPRPRPIAKKIGKMLGK